MTTCTNKASLCLKTKSLTPKQQTNLTYSFSILPPLGTVGDWKNHFTPKQNKLFEEMFSNKMKYSDLAKCITYEF